MKYFFWHLALVSEFFIRAAFIGIITRDPILRRHRYVKNTNYIGKKLLKSFLIELKIIHPERLEAMQHTNYLAVSNHVSYTDIIILAALDSYVFITSVEMGNNVFLGNITRSGGCLFTDRKKFVSLPKEIEKFANTIKQGFKLMLFPEGTSTNGEAVKDFRKSLFQVAVLANCPVLPICIKYKTLDGKAIKADNRDLIYWYGDMEFAPHIMKLLGRRIEAEIEILEPVYVQPETTRQELSDGVFKQISACYNCKNCGNQEIATPITKENT
jgi:1-acyl-sn-glycerol-3-phosphate acyltransferase